jgi:hypothetical protein
VKNILKRTLVRDSGYAEQAGACILKDQKTMYREDFGRIVFDKIS